MIPGIKKILFENRMVHPVTGCWLWMGRCNKEGYGVISLPDETTARGRRDYSVHRLAYAEFKGEPQNSVLHIPLCFFKNCFWPEHLYDGTQKDNVGDMIILGTGRNKYGGFERTHCIREHPLTPENTRIDKNGHKICKLCGQERMRKYRNK